MGKLGGIPLDYPQVDLDRDPLDPTKLPCNAGPFCDKQIMWIAVFRCA